MVSSNRPRNVAVLSVSILLIWALCSASPKAEGFTFEQVMSAPFPSHLVASQSSDRVAGIFNDRGCRNVWVVDGSDYVPRKVTSYNEGATTRVWGSIPPTSTI